MWVRGVVKSAVIAGVLLAFPVAQVSAATFDIFGTGLDGSGTPLALGASDPNYTIDEVGDAQAVVRTGLPGTYFGNDSNSQWIWQQANGQPIGGAPPNGLIRTFTTTFDLTGFDHTTAVINGAWGTDNQGLRILLNGVDSGVAPLLGVIVGNFSSLTAFVISAGFQAGLNTLQFVIEDNGSQGAFRAELSGVAAVPIPAALPLFGGALAALGFAGWRRRRQAGPA